MANLNDRDQVIRFQQFLFGRTISTVAIPQPSIGWVGEDIAGIRQQWRAAPAVEIADLPAEEFHPTLADLVRVVKHFNTRQPNLTRAILTEIDTLLIAADQAAKAGRINAAYPNVEGTAGANDSFVSIMDFTLEVVQDGDFFLNRLLNGEQWLDKYDEMKSLLADT